MKCGKLIRGQSVVLRLDQKHHIRLAEGSIHRSFLLPDLGARPLAGYDYGGHMTLSELVRQYYVRGLLRCPLKRALLKLWGYCISFSFAFQGFLLRPYQVLRSSAGRGHRAIKPGYHRRRQGHGYHNTLVIYSHTSHKHGFIRHLCCA